MRPSVNALTVAGLALAILSSTGTNAAVHSRSDVPAPDRPNLVFIMADDLGYGDLGCYGQRKIKTPHIDRLAAEGVRFTNYYAGSTVCAPSRSVLMTGQHTGHTRVRGNAGQGNPLAQSLRPEDVTVARVLKQAGYATGHAGKWGLGDEGPAAVGMPTRHGYDFFFGYLNQHHAHNYYPAFLIRGESRVSLPNQVKPIGADGGGVATKRVAYSPDSVLDEAMQFIDRNRDRPFFLYFSPTLPHANNEATRELGDGTEVPDYGIYEHEPWTKQNKGHAAMITYLDTQVGLIMEWLQSHGLDERTIVFFTSDNGPHKEAGNDPDFFNASGGLRGLKRSLTDGGIRVPMIVRWPGRIEAGSVTDHVAYHGDLMATAAELAGTQPPEPLDSISYLPTLLGRPHDQKQHAYLYWEFYEGGSAQAVRVGQWKLIRKPMLTGPIQLFDLTSDRSESHDVSAQHPDVITRAKSAMDEAHVPSPDWPVPAGSKASK